MPHTPPAAASHAAEGEHKHTNRLVKEQSPYLLQHAHNPVDWFPWGSEAFEAARSQNKPIFLSVGYATCHWCHVMEHESFESEETAALMNKHFINVKVDREERPDVDRVYMTYVQATTGGGGWPMSVWLTPDLKPFYGGTYYPGKDQYGLPSFTTVLKKISQLWGSRQTDLQAQADDIMQQLQEFTSGLAAAPSGAESQAGADPAKLAAAVTACAKALSKGFDSKLGGFGGPPKFPRPSEINLLLRAASQAAASEAAASTSSKASSAAPSSRLLLGMSLFSLQAMAAGGMFDQLGGGFHRYSVDEFWHVPHFEKMLYDNPQLALTYLDAFRITLAARRSSSSSGASSGGSGSHDSAPAAAAAAAAGSSKGLLVDDDKLGDPGVFAAVVQGVLDYLRRDMTHPEGGLYSAEDADSLDPATNKKSEGAFYVWTAAELEEVLGAERAAVFSDIYGVKAEGNCTLSARSDPHDEFGGKNVLMQFTRPQPEQQQLLGECRKLLFDRRAQRPRPSLDDKIVTAWNGQGISAFAVASRVLAAEQPPAVPCFPVDGCAPSTYLQAAVQIASFVQHHVWDASSRRLRRAYCKAPSAVEGFADDYVLLIAGLLDLYEAGGGLGWLQWALQLQDSLDTLFWDETGGYYQSSGSDPSIQLRLKEDYDGAEPAASSIAAHNLIRLAGLMPAGESPSSSSSSGGMATGQQAQAFSARADAVLAAFLPRMERVGIAMPQMCVAAWLRTRVPLRQVIISGKASHPNTSALLDAAHAAWAPDKSLILIDPTDPDSVEFWRSNNPAAWSMVEHHYAKSAAAAAGPPAAAAASVAGASEVAAAAGADGGYLPTAFVCQNYTCQAPTSSTGRLYELLSVPAGRGGPAGSVKLTPVKL